MSNVDCIAQCAPLKNRLLLLRSESIGRTNRVFLGYTPGKAVGNSFRLKSHAINETIAPRYFEEIALLKCAKKELSPQEGSLIRNLI